MSKQVVILFDGTWNVPAASLPDKSEKATNIYRIWKGLGGSDLEAYQPALESHENTAFGALFYIRGVGTSGGGLQESLVGATGAGVIQRIALAYRWFCSTYDPGDVVSVFGFSRGAFAARSFCGLLDASGVGSLLTEREARRAVFNYLDGTAAGSSVPVQYLGIFDTVGSTVERESDHKLSPRNVKFARHALAIDEMRKSFWPHFWDRKQQITKVEEAWFVGAHSNIGGSYPDKNLSNIALFWILKGAKRAGINVPFGRVAGWSEESVGIGRMDSWGDWFGNLPPLTSLIATRRKIHQRKRVIPSHHKLHESVQETFATDKKYKPLATIEGEPLTAEYAAKHRALWDMTTADLRTL